MGKGTNIYRVPSVSDRGNSFIFGPLQAPFSFIFSEMYCVKIALPPSAPPRPPPHPAFLTLVEKGWREISTWRAFEESALCFLFFRFHDSCLLVGGMLSNVAQPFPNGT